MDIATVRQGYVLRLNALNQELANGQILKDRMQAEMKALVEQMRRIEGAKVMLQEMIKLHDAQLAAEAAAASKGQSEQD